MIKEHKEFIKKANKQVEWFQKGLLSKEEMIINIDKIYQNFYEEQRKKRIKSAKS